jgi:sulfite exporter TauE/SafE
MALQVIIPAFLLGFAGSVHCIGMCGPLALSVPVAGGRGSRVRAGLIYNTGRVATYSMLGAIFGLAGRSFAWFGWQQRFSLVLGVLILLFVLVPGLSSNRWLSAGAGKLFMRVRNRFSTVLFRGNPGSILASGVLNGILPCGLVYLALAGAAATGQAMDGALFMMFFGWGTLPVMFSVVFFGTVFKQNFRIRMRSIYPAMMAVMAILLIIRGLNLGIPYLSPKIPVPAADMVDCHR